MTENKDYKLRPIDVDKIDLEKMKEKTADLPGLLEYAHTLGGFSIVPTEQGAIKGKAMQAMTEQTEMHLGQIFEQMQVLARQAKTIKDRAEISQDIYTAEMRFKPEIGETYYLYEREEGVKLLSLVAPKEWGKSIPFKSFVAKVRLLADHTWDVLEEN